jgi:hypothetical protein
VIANLGGFAVRKVGACVGREESFGELEYVMDGKNHNQLGGWLYE